MADANPIPAMHEHSVDELYDYYPLELYSTALKNRSGKAKASKFEVIRTDMYEPEYNMIAFHTTAFRLPLWVRAA